MKYLRFIAMCLYCAGQQINIIYLACAYMLTERPNNVYKFKPHTEQTHSVTRKHLLTERRRVPYLKLVSCHSLQQTGLDVLPAGRHSSSTGL